MSDWTSEELEKIAAADELQLASVRRDGTLRRPVTIWVVRHGDDLYVRSVYGRTSGWLRGFRSAMRGTSGQAVSTRTSRSWRSAT